MAGIFKIGISQNTKCDILVGFPKSGHIYHDSSRLLLQVRKAAHEGLAHMIQSGLKSADDVTIHPVAVSLAKFCHNQFEQGRLCYHLILVVTMVTGSSTGTLHVLNLLKDTFAHMSSQVLPTFAFNFLVTMIFTVAMVSGNKEIM